MLENIGFCFGKSESYFFLARLDEVKVRAIVLPPASALASMLASAAALALAKC